MQREIIMYLTAIKIVEEIYNNKKNKNFIIKKIQKNLQNNV